jgi:WD40 repeat protein
MGGTWSHDGVILFGRLGGPIHRVSRSGGTATPVTVLDQTRGETGHTFPSFLPDGRRFFYYVVSVGRDTRALRAASIDSKNVTLILPKVTRAEFVAPGFLVYSQANDLVAQPFNADELQVQGDPIRLAEQVRANPDRGGSPFSVSPTGILAYRTGTFLHDVTELVWLDGQGKELTRLSEAAEYLGPVLSPEGKRIAFARDDPIDTTHDIWLLDISRGTVSRFTFTDAANEDNPVWSPDGKQLAFRSDRGGTVKLSRRPAVGPDYDEVLLESPNPKSALSWSRDGQFLLYREQGAATRWDLWVLPLSGSPKPIPFAASPFNEASGQFSPNGRWIAYESDETGRREIYVQRFPPTADKWQVSTHGGRLPRWRPDGRGLFFVALDQKLMRVQLTPGPAFDAGVPRAVFDFHGFGESYTTYTPTPDGRFLINRISPAGGAQPLTVVLNWRAAIKK